MKKVCAVNGSVSDLVKVLNGILEDYCDMNISVCGVMPVQVYWDDNNGTIILDNNADLEDEEE